MRMKANKTGKVAIFDESGGNAPFDDPFNNIDKTRFHSDFGYISIQQKLTGSITLPVTEASNCYTPPRVNNYVIGNYSGNTPWLYGKATFDYVKGSVVASATVPIIGTVPVGFYATSTSGYYSGSARWMTLGIVGSNIVLREYTPQSLAGWVAMQVQYEVFVTDLRF